MIRLKRFVYLQFFFDVFCLTCIISSVDVMRSHRECLKEATTRIIAQREDIQDLSERIDSLERENRLLRIQLNLPKKNEIKWRPSPRKIASNQRSH